MPTKSYFCASGSTPADPRLGMADGAISKMFCEGDEFFKQHAPIGAKNYLGDDLEPALLDRMTKVVQGTSKEKDSWQTAQLHELAFWRWVAFMGYQGMHPLSFAWHQRLWMLSNFAHTGWGLGELEHMRIAEVGCGPLGMIEYLPGKYKAAFDPLNRHYQVLFRKARQGGVSYYCDLDHMLADGAGSYDLVICFNVLDHAKNARELFDKTMRLIRPGGRYLIQVNLSKDGYEQSPAHREMHPSPMKYDAIRHWLGGHSATDEEYQETEPSSENEFFYMTWGTTSTANRSRAAA